MPRAINVSENHFLDLSALVLALRDGTTLGADSQVLDRGAALLRRNIGMVESSAELTVEGLAARADAPTLRLLYRRVETAPSTVAGILDRYVPMMEQLFQWLNRHQDALRQKFSGRGLPVARGLSDVVVMQDPLARLRGLAALSSATNMVAPKAWIRELAESLDTLPSQAALAVADTTTATMAAEEYGQAVAQARASGVDAEDDVNVQVAREQLDTIVDMAADPIAARAGASAAVAWSSTSQVAREFGLTREQEAVLWATGPIVMPAGAGSGKTQTVVSLVAHLVRERGYSPDQIMVCSFTRAAAAEVDARIQNQARVSGATVGTTHSIARSIISNNRPDLIPQLRPAKAKLAERIFKLAVRQVGLSVAEYQSEVDQNRKYLAMIERVPGWRYSPFLKAMHQAISDGKKLSENQSSTLVRILKDKNLLQEDGLMRAAAARGEDEILAYWDKPVGEWFNIGEDVGPERAAKLAVENFQNSRLSVDQLRADEGSYDRKLVALYGAYEFLKYHHSEGPILDFNDQLTTALDILENDPRALLREQGRHKVIVVDEAQDLNDVQFSMFELLSKKTDRYLLVGDDKQCVHVDSLVATPDGLVRAGNLSTGDRVLSYRAGTVVPQEVRAAEVVGELEGLVIRTRGGRELTMSRDHRLWAAPPARHLVVLEYADDLGFSLSAVDGPPSHPHATTPGRLERRTWVLGTAASLAEVEAEVERLSSCYGITAQGGNGFPLLRDRDLLFAYPAWSSSEDGVVLRAHGDSGTVIEESGAPSYPPFPDYRDALTVADQLAMSLDAPLFYALDACGMTLAEVGAAQIMPGFTVVCLDESGSPCLDEVASVGVARGLFVDLDVDDASTFFAGGILTHNCIYEFRGAKPKNFINASKREGVTICPLTKNFRSGSSIVDAANKLIAHNENRQIPMVCEADVERRGTGEIRAVPFDTHESAAVATAVEIKDAVDEGASPKDFGILVRNNAEVDAYALNLAVRGIPYRTLKAENGGFFGRPLVRALLSWMRLFTSTSESELNDAFLEAHRTPGFNLDDKFADGLRSMVSGESYYDFVARGGEVYDPRNKSVAWRNRNAQAYVQQIQALRVQGLADSKSLVSAILDVKGVKKTFVEALMEKVSDEDLEQSSGGEKDDDARRNAALVPLRPILVMAEHFKDPKGLLDVVRKLQAANEKLEKKNPTDKEDWAEPAVLIGTVHGWKGLEADYVYVSSASGVFPHFKAEQAAREQAALGQEVTALDSERRLYYVALTRGRKGVTVNAPQINYRGREGSPSVFISEACIKFASSSENPASVKTASTRARGYASVRAATRTMLDQLVGRS